MTAADDAGGALAPELLERMRTIGLRLDRAGRLWHQGIEVTHARLRQALLRWLDVLEDGRDVVRLDAARYAYVEVEDAHLRAVAARWEGDRCYLRWDDDHEEELAYGTLRQGDDLALRVAARGRLRGRVGGPAYHAVLARAVEDGAGFALEARGRRFPIPGAR